MKGLKLMMKKTWRFVGLMVLFASFASQSQTLRPGTWRFELKTTHGAVPFLLVFHKNKSQYTATLKNGPEIIKLSEIRINDKKIEIPLQTYQSSLELDLTTAETLSGFLVRHNKNPILKTPIEATFGKDERFPGIKQAAKIDLTGRWKVKLTEEDKTQSPGVLVFKQQGNQLTGSLLTPTGDYRYVEGYVSGDEFEAASFDGIYNYLLKGKVIGETLNVQILSSSKTIIEGTRDAKADIPDPYAQTQVTELNFSFPDLTGKMVSLSDKKFRNKPVIVQFFGSWCPNCMDEMNFLIPWYKENKRRGIEIVALSFERSLSVNDAKNQVLKVQKKKQIPYTILMAGYTSEDKPMNKITGLTNFISFPTTVFLNKKHQVVKVHAGFTGPSTGEFYVKWQNEFNQTINEILK